MDCTPNAGPRSVLRGRLRSSSAEPKREQRDRSPPEAPGGREEPETRRKDMYQQVVILEDG